MESHHLLQCVQRLRELVNDAEDECERLNAQRGTLHDVMYYEAGRAAGVNASLSVVWGIWQRARKAVDEALGEEWLDAAAVTALVNFCTGAPEGDIASWLEMRVKDGSLARRVNEDVGVVQYRAIEDDTPF